MLLYYPVENSKTFKVSSSSLEELSKEDEALQAADSLSFLINLIMYCNAGRPGS